MPKMSGIYAQTDLPIRRYQDLAQKLYSPLLYGENSTLLFFPSNGMSYDVHNLWLREEDRAAVLGPLRERFTFAYVHLVNPNTYGRRVWLEQFRNAFGYEGNTVDDIEDFARQLKQSITDGKEPTFLIHIPVSLSDETLRLFFEFASQILYISPSRIHILFCMEMRWSHGEFIQLTHDFHTLFQHTSIISAPTNEEIYHLLRHYCSAWQYPLPERVVSLIVQQSGGSFLFAKYILRLIVAEKMHTVKEVDRAIRTHAYVMQRVEYFISRLSPIQRNILAQIAAGGEVKEDSETSLLVDLDIIRRNAVGYVIRSPILHRACVDKNAQPDIANVIRQSEVFSTREKSVLVALISAKGSTVFRDDVAEIIWGSANAQKYSDWVIDQTISRIRKKMSTLPALQSLTIQSQKKKGFTVLSL